MLVPIVVLEIIEDVISNFGHHWDMSCDEIVVEYIGEHFSFVFPIDSFRNEHASA